MEKQDVINKMIEIKEKIIKIKKELDNSPNYNKKINNRIIELRKEFTRLEFECKLIKSERKM